MDSITKMKMKEESYRIRGSKTNPELSFVFKSTIPSNIKLNLFFELLKKGTKHSHTHEYDIILYMLDWLKWLADFSEEFRMKLFDEITKKYIDLLENENTGNPREIYVLAMLYNYKGYGLKLKLKYGPTTVETEKGDKICKIILKEYIKSYSLFESVKKDVDTLGIIPNFHSDFAGVCYDISDLYIGIDDSEKRLKYLLMSVDEIKKSPIFDICTSFESKYTIDAADLSMEFNKYSQATKILLCYVKRLRNSKLYPVANYRKEELNALFYLEMCFNKLGKYKYVLTMIENRLLLIDELIEKCKNDEYSVKNLESERPRCHYLMYSSLLKIHGKRNSKMDKYFPLALKYAKDDEEKIRFLFGVKYFGDYYVPEKVVRKCEKCGKIASKRCGNCMLFYYCSANCQKLDWKDHKECCYNVLKVHKISEQREKEYEIIRQEFIKNK